MSVSEIHVVDEVAEDGKTVVPVATHVHDGKEYQEMVLGLVTGPYNQVYPSYTGDDLTSVVYKQDGVTLCTITIGYTSGKITSVERS